MARQSDELKRYILSLPPESVWRPVHDHGGTLLRRGGGKFADILPETLEDVRLAGRGVVDLGCNLGAYALLAARQGAARVVGVDIDLSVITGCRMLARDHGLRNIEFKVVDFLKTDLGERFDLGMLIDFIGRSVVAKGKVRACLEALMRVSRQEMLLTLRPEYHVRDGLGCASSDLEALYPSRFLRQGRMLVLEYAAEVLGQEWELRTDCPGRFKDGNLKTRVRAFRKTPHAPDTRDDTHAVKPGIK